MARKKATGKSRDKQSKKRRKQTRGKKNKSVKKKQQMSSSLDWFFGTGDIFSHLKFHCNTTWLATNLAMQALIFSWSEKKCVTDAFTESQDRCKKLGHSVNLGSYQGFIRALANSLSELMPVMMLRLQEMIEKVGGDFWRVSGFVPVAFDGSRSDAPRTVPNEAEFCAPNFGKGKTAKYRKKNTKGMRRTQNKKNKPADPKPQVWITLLWHMGLRLPLRWRLGPSNSSERSHVSEMIKEGNFPENTLFCGDAGFIGHDFWKLILDEGHDFLVRVGANASLLFENKNYERCKDGTVLSWPKGKQSKSPPLRLRLVQIKVGKADMYLLTSVLDPKRLSRKEIGELYAMRWGIEIEFRGLKQTIQKAKLRCRQPQRLYAELSWSIMAMALAELLALRQQIPATKSIEAGPDGQTYQPKWLSLANTMRAIYHCLDNLNDAVGDDDGLNDQLRKALVNRYVPKAKKAARYRPKNPDKKKLGAPALRRITAQEKEKMKKITQQNAA